MDLEIQFNCLVFFTSQNSVNTRLKDGQLQRSLARQALTLAASLGSCGHSLRVFTNDADRLRELLRSDLVEVKQLGFPSQIPAEFSFFAAHHKIYLFSEFARETRLNCLLDTDVFAHSAKASLQRVIAQNPQVDGWLYDISDQVFPVFGTERVQSDLHALVEGLSFPRWYGGEFILGRSKLFAYLAEECQRLLPKYIQLAKNFHHSGDEILVSAALNRNALQLRLADAGASGIVIRHWTGRTAHAARPIEALKKTFLWHLPDAKSLLVPSVHSESLFAKLRRVQSVKRTVALFRT